MAKEQPVSELKRVQPTHGPYAHTHIDIPTADADAAIADGWAIDPYAVVDPKAEAKVLTEDDHAKANAAADAYNRKLRGEPEPEAEKPAKKSVVEKSSDAGSGGDAGYQTRQASPAPAAKPAAAAPAAAPASTAAKSTK